jgi:hypothetical protein
MLDGEPGATTHFALLEAKRVVWMLGGATRHIDASL